MPEATDTLAVRRPLKVLLFANTEWYLFNFRLALAKAVRAQGVEVVLVSPPGAYGEGLLAEGFCPRHRQHELHHPTRADRLHGRGQFPLFRGYRD